MTWVCNVLLVLLWVAVLQARRRRIQKAVRIQRHLKAAKKTWHTTLCCQRVCVCVCVCVWFVYFGTHVHVYRAVYSEGHKTTCNTVCRGYLFIGNTHDAQTLLSQLFSTLWVNWDLDPAKQDRYTSAFSSAAGSWAVTTVLWCFEVCHVNVLFLNTFIWPNINLCYIY